MAFLKDPIDRVMETGGFPARFREFFQMQIYTKNIKL